MKKVLMITRAFYPSDTAGAHRAAKFAKYLLNFGWDPIVLCPKWTKENSFGRYDPNLLEQNIHRVIPVRYTTHKPNSILGIFDRICKKLLPKIYPLQLYQELRKYAFKICRNENIDLIWATSPPLMTLSIASELASEMKIPWVADFRDLADEFTDNPNCLCRHHIMKEIKLCKTASGIITVNESLARKLSKRHTCPVYVVYNGFDREDYQGNFHVKKDVFTIIYCGLIYGNRNPIPLFQALDILLDEGKIHPASIEILFYGEPENRLKPYINDMKYKNIVKSMGRVPYHEITQIEQSASLLLLLSHQNTKGIMTYKIFEYLAAGRPILSVPGDNDVTDRLIQETGSGYVGRNSDEIAKIISDCYAEWKVNGTVKFNGISEKIEMYSREKQTAQLAKIFNLILEQ